MDSWHLQTNQLFDRRSLGFLKRWWLNIDKINFLLILGIIGFGLMMTASSSPAIASRIEVGKFFFLKKQIVFAIIAIFILITISFLNHDQIKVISLFGLVGTIAMLVLVLMFGAEAKGAKRWISLAGITLQPSEFAKAFFVICNAFLLQKFSKSPWYITYGNSFALFSIIAILLLLQPDFGMTLTFAVLWSAQIFLYGLPLPLIAALGVMVITLGVGAYIKFPHVQNRITYFLDSSGKNYQVERSLDAFVNGSYTGTGPGNGVVKNFIPDAHTDFIFAVIGEEYGILTCCFIVIIFFYLVTRIIRRAYKEDHMFIYLSLCGLAMQFCMQAMINIGVSLRLLPTKGMTLPFISYGGSSMLSTAICFGLILAFTKRKYHTHVDYGNLKLM